MKALMPQCARRGRQDPAIICAALHYLYRCAVARSAALPILKAFQSCAALPGV